jgi:hypothetical protein
MIVRYSNLYRGVGGSVGTGDFSTKEGVCAVCMAVWLSVSCVVIVSWSV